LPPAVAAAAAAAAGNSGRDVGVLWDTFASYANAQSKQVTSAFTKHGYTLATAVPEIRKAIDTLNLDLPAHGSRGPGHPVHPAFTAAAGRWVVALKGWAEAHPVGPRVKVRGLEHTPEEREERRLKALVDDRKQEKNKKKAYCEANGGHDYLPWGGPCKNCGTAQ